MKKMLLAVALSLCTMAVTQPARAFGIAPGPALVAGWDFSQYFVDGALSIDGATFTDVLGANYSSLIKEDFPAVNTFGAGPDAAQYGTMYLNGQFGSTAQDIGNGGATSILPSAQTIVSNVNATVPFGVIEFEAWEVLQFLGQEFAGVFAMTALETSSLVFGVNSPLPGSDWAMSFSGQTQVGAGVGQVEVQFSPDGENYVTRQLIQLTGVDTAYTVALTDALLSGGFVRLNFLVQGAAAPLIDHVAISANLVPEPGTALLLLSGLAGLTAYGRRSSR